jgi:hypothetical protein
LGEEALLISSGNRGYGESKEVLREEAEGTKIKAGLDMLNFSG